MWLFMIKIFLQNRPIGTIWSSDVRPYVCIILSPSHAIFVPSLSPSFPPSLLLWDLLPFSTFKLFSVSIQTAPNNFTLASQPEWVGLQQGGQLSIVQPTPPVLCTTLCGSRRWMTSSVVQGRAVISTGL